MVDIPGESSLKLRSCLLGVAKPGETEAPEIVRFDTIA
jgi:hypothetical protein